MKNLNLSKLITKIALVAAVLFSSMQEVKAQFDVGADIMSRYVWRGAGYSNGCLLYTSPSPRDRG